MNIRSMPLSERPDVKLAYYGTDALTNAELLSIVLGTGTKDRNALELADDILCYANETIGDLCAADVRELVEIKGVGQAKAGQIVAALELGRRLDSARKNRQLTRIIDSRHAADLLAGEFEFKTKEHFIVLCLNTKMQLISREVISVGSLDSAPVHPREVFMPAVKKSAAAIIVAHTHPSGDPMPSGEDIEVTERLLEASRIMGIRLMDHIIIGRGRYCSMKNEGYFTCSDESDMKEFKVSFKAAVERSVTVWAVSEEAAREEFNRKVRKGGLSISGDEIGGYEVKEV